MNKILLLGGGGHCASIVDSLLELDLYDEIGIVQNEPAEYLLGKIPVVGCDADLLKLRDEGYSDAFVAVGSIGDSRLRERLFANICNAGFEIPNIIDKTAVVSPSCQLGRGVFIGKRAVVNAKSTLGNGVIINTGSIVEHDCRLEAFVHVATGAVLCGGVQVGSGTHIGAGAMIRQGLKIGNRTIIGMGSVVVNDCDECMVLMGNPAKVRR